VPITFVPIRKQFNNSYSSTTIPNKIQESAISGLKISLEKSTLYMAGLRDLDKEEILHSFPFESVCLPIRYLSFPLLTRK